MSIDMNTPRPFSILGIQQIAIGGTDKSALSLLWQQLFGLELVTQFQSAKENVDEDVLRLGSGVHQVEVDLMQPLDPDKKPQVQNTPLNHIGLWVDDLPKAVDWLTKNGVRFAPGGIRPGATGHDICFIHPKANDAFPISGSGVLIELVQAPEDVIASK